MKEVAYSSLSSETMLYQVLRFQRNEVELHDQWYNSFGYPTFEGHFYDTADNIYTNFLKQHGTVKDIYYNLFVQPQKEIKFHTREVYSILELIGDLGGVLEIFVLVFVFLVSPITEYSFTMKAI